MNKKKEHYLKNKISQTPKRTLKIKAKALTGIDKIKGLVGQAKLYPIYFETRFGIHTFGVAKPIDVLILDDNFRVVQIYRSLKPRKVIFWNPKYSKVIETPANYIKINILDEVVIN